MRYRCPSPVGQDSLNNIPTDTQGQLDIVIHCLLSITSLNVQNHWSESVLDGMSVKSTSICSLIELQEEVGRQCSLYDFILVDKGEEAGEGLQELLGMMTRVPSVFAF